MTSNNLTTLQEDITDNHIEIIRLNSLLDIAEWNLTVIEEEIDCLNKTVIASEDGKNDPTCAQ